MAVVALSAGARAGDPEALIRSGVELRKTGRDQQALPLFQQAVAEKRTPRGLAQLAFCEQALGLWPAAESHLEEALKGQGDDAWKEKNGKALRYAGFGHLPAAFQESAVIDLIIAGLKWTAYRP